MQIKHILGTKGAQVIVIAPEASVGDLIGLLNEHNLGAVVVSSDGGTLEGIVSERDIIRHAGDEGLLAAPVSTIMTAEVYSCSPEDSVAGLMAVMTERRIRHVPVLVEGRLAGIVSIGDVVKDHVTDLEFERDQLHGYVHG